MPHDGCRALWPVRVGEIKSVHKDSCCPVKPDKARKSQSSAVASKQLGVQHQSQHAKDDDGQHCESTLYPKQLPIKGHQLLHVLFATQSECPWKPHDQDQTTS